MSFPNSMHISIDIQYTNDNYIYNKHTTQYSYQLGSSANRHRTPTTTPTNATPNTGTTTLPAKRARNPVIIESDQESDSGQYI